jgi:hypothetical protein
MIGLRWDVDVLARFELQLAFAADDVRDALDDYPVLAAARVSLQTQASARLHFESFNFVAFTLFKDFVPPPWSLVSFASHRILLLKKIILNQDEYVISQTDDLRHSCVRITKRRVVKQEKEKDGELVEAFAVPLRMAP